ncbi:MAG: hypothetical protein Q9160_005722 [Pyrenula sp. 1 TL-2023]
MSLHDTANKPTTSSSHRLPTLTASQAIQQAIPPTPLKTNLPTLDTFLQPLNPLSVTGLQHGYVTETYGPPGSGKTAFGMQVAALALNQDKHVVWLDTAAPLPTSRFREVLDPLKSTNPQSPPPLSSDSPTQNLLENFHYTHLPSLAHLLTLLIHSAGLFPPSGTHLLVIDTLSTLLPVEPKKRFPISTTLAQSLRKFALLHDIAVLVLNQCGTSIRDSGNGRKRAVLRSAVFGKGWEDGVNTSICLFRDFVPGGAVGRFANILRGVKGSSRGRIGFEIRSEGLCEVTSARQRPSNMKPADSASLSASKPPLPQYPPKRKAGEIADSEDEDEDDLLPSVGVTLQRTSSDDFADPLDGDWEALVAAEKGLGEEGEGNEMLEETGWEEQSVEPPKEADATKID